MSDSNDPRIDALMPLISRMRTDVSAVRRPGKAASWTTQEITRERIAQHLNSGPARGLCPIRAGENVTSVAVLDFDSHKGEVSWAEMSAVVARVVDELDFVWGMSPIVFRSSGGNGVHIYLLWDQPQDAYSVRQFLGGVLRGCGLKSGTRGVKDGEVEVFPRQDYVPEGKFGNMVVLPLAGKSERVELDDLAGVLYGVGMAADAWRDSPPVPVLVKPATQHEAREPGLSETELELFWQALDAIPNDDVGYDVWLAYCHAAHWATGGSAEGLERFEEWSARSSKHVPGYAELKVWNYADERRVGGITAATVFAAAGRAGWVNPATVTVPDADEFGLEGAAALRAAESEVESDEELFGAMTLIHSKVPATREIGPPSDFSGLPAGVGAANALERREKPEDHEPPAYYRDKQGIVKPTVENAVRALSDEWEVGMQIGHDAFRDEMMVQPAGAVQQWRAMKDADLVRLRIELEKRKFKAAPKELARDAAVLVAERNQFDSAQLWLAGVEPCWDGVARVETFLSEFFGAADTPYTRAVSLYMWTALAGRVIEPGCIAPMAPILKGPQGSGKSRGVKAIVPDDLFFAEIDLSKDDDTLARSLRGVLVGEINELRGLQTKDQESIKAWVSRTHEKWVPKFKEFATTFPRRCLLVGTTNRDDILADETGNRRWLPLAVGRVRVGEVARLREQLWAEAAAMFRGVRLALDGARAAGEGYVGGVAWQEAERLAGAEHDAFRRVDPWEGAFAEWLDGHEGLDDGVHVSAGVARGSAPFTVCDVLTGALGMAVKDADARIQMRAGAVLRALGYDKHQKRVAGVRAVYWGRVNPVNPEENEG